MNTSVQIAALTPDEDTFALAVIEYGGNLGAAYRAVYGSEANMPVARAREMITRPEIAKRVQELTMLTEEHALISLGSHVIELATIRDLSKENKQFKVALDAEKARGEVAGFYGAKGPKNPNPASTTPLVNINIGSSSGNIADWAVKHGNTPVVIDMPK
jgi:hypothetical protein